MDNNERVIGDLLARVTNLELQGVRIETKVDSLLSFRGWVLGVGASVSGFVSLIVAWIANK